MGGVGGQGMAKIASGN